MPSPNHSANDTLAGQILLATGESATHCVQCGRCAAGCPQSADIDHPPCEVLRLVQQRRPDTDTEALGSLSIWLCLTCDACRADCPHGVDLPRIMGFLRQESRRRGLTHPRARDVVDFHRFFLDAVGAGRPREAGAATGYRPRTRRFMRDMQLQPKLFLRGKLSPFPHRIHGSGAVARLFTKDKFKRD
jgi:heterodisulfide reductase subunit C2